MAVKLDPPAEKVQSELELNVIAIMKAQVDITAALTAISKTIADLTPRLERLARGGKF